MLELEDEKLRKAVAKFRGARNATKWCSFGRESSSLKVKFAFVLGVFGAFE
jgi:hypothetical protein